MADNPTYHKGRGAQFNPDNRFNALHHDPEMIGDQATRFIPTAAKSIVNKVDSPDIPMPYSMNPYQGCEHGCIYCYARNTHPYWGYSAGLDFEQKILVKKDAPALLKKFLNNKNYKPLPILISGNTDCYQPAEQKFKLTRELLKICADYRQPVSLITKNALILRDLDILRDLGTRNLAQVLISITTLDESLRSLLEPRTSTALKRLKTLEELNKNGIPACLMMAPVIPGLTDHEIPAMAKAAFDHGAPDIYYSILRLNGDVAILFEDWLEKNFPERAKKILNRTAECHGGQVQDSRFKIRMKGEGNYAEMIRNQFKQAKQKFNLPAIPLPPLSCDQFKIPSAQLNLFDV
ncbi:MAG: PA0069 family radical SAM protein [Saprospiraceae bacterium]|nr:PA0069 family radical SAM protein [Saprospiraceae bacterium]